MTKLKNLWNLMWGKYNFYKTLGFHLFMFGFLALMVFNGDAVDDWLWQFGGNSIWAFTPMYLPIFLILVFWVGNFISFNKRGRI